MTYSSSRWEQVYLTYGCRKTFHHISGSFFLLSLFLHYLADIVQITLQSQKKPFSLSIFSPGFFHACSSLLLEISGSHWLIFPIVSMSHIFSQYNFHVTHLPLAHFCSLSPFETINCMSPILKFLKHWEERKTISQGYWEDGWKWHKHTSFSRFSYPTFSDSTQPSLLHLS